jgi:shikimate dehydrogenase
MTGRDRHLLLGLVGAGIQRSMAPLLHEEEGRHHGLRIHYQLVDLDASGVGADVLPELVRAMRIVGFDGFNVTFPCKQQVIPLLDALSDEARAIGAVNTVVRHGSRLVGHNTDGSGWSWGFRRELPDVDLDHVVLVGAGGAGSACADAVLRLGAARLSVHDRDIAQADALVDRLNAHLGGRRALRAHDLRSALAGATGVIQATPVGMTKCPGFPFEPSWLQPRCWLSEIVYLPLETPLLAAARRIGCRVIDGGHMNVGQAVQAFGLFTGLQADADRLDAHFRRTLRSGD